MSAERLAEIAEELPASLAEFVEPEPTPAEEPEPKVEPKPADPMAEKAGRLGWRPKEEFEGDPDEWVDAAEFVRRKPLFDRLHKQEKALREKQEKLDALAKHTARVEEMTRKRVLDELEAERLKAVEEGNAEAFKDVDKRIKEVEKEQIPVPEVKAAEIPEEIQSFAKRNEKWFEKDEDMTDYALKRAEKYGAQGKPMSEFLPLVEADVKRAFAHKFTNPNKEKPAAVAGNNSEARAKSYTYADLNDEQKSVWATLKKNMAFDDYVKELKALGDLK